MQHLPQTHLGQLAWTELMPTESGHYFVTSEDMMGELYVSIEVNDQGVYSLDDSYEMTSYEEGQGYLFLGPILFNKPTHFPVIVATSIPDDSKGNAVDV
jgi:hypothetical protein